MSTPAHLTQHTHDETLDPTGSPHAGWRAVTERIASFSPAELTRRQAEIQRQLRTNGLAYGTADLACSDSRPWPLDIVPQVVVPADWQRLSRGLAQRARLKQALFADLYGARQVLHDRVLPPSLVFAHRGFLRNASGVSSALHLPLFATDVSRSPSGDWYVVDDHAQVPIGMGYTLENRLVLSRVLPNLYRSARVHRVAGWFRALQQLLVGLIDVDARCVILGYGASHQHYFEHAYLAKYLGYTLVEPSDLTVRHQRCWLKTIDGLRRVDVILRFVEDRHTDPLAVNDGGGYGVAGLLQAVAGGQVRLINPIGAAVVENPALNAYLPALAHYYLGTDIDLLSAPTYWLGDAEQRAHVTSRFDALLYRETGTLGQLLDPTTLAEPDAIELRRVIERDPEQWVAQERLDRSVAPSLYRAEHGLQQITVRGFLLDDGERIETMPGGLCLLDTVAGGRRPAMDALEGCKDVWVLSDEPVRPDTLLPQYEDTVRYAIVDGELPSRVADNQFWFGRYAESAESLVRVLRGVCHELQNDDSPIDADTPTPALVGLLRALTAITGATPGFIGRGARRRLARPARELQSLMFDAGRAGSLAYVLEQVQRTAGTVRDRISPELLRVLNELDDREQRLLSEAPARPFAIEPEALLATVERLEELLTSLSALAGLASENLTRGDGWRFLMLGRRVERARLSSMALAQFALQPDADSRLLETVLALFDSIITYRSRYRSEIDERLVLQLLLLDESNPRSVAFQFRQIETLIGELPGRGRAGQTDPLMRLAHTGLSRVRLADASALLAAGRTGRQSLPTLLQVLSTVPVSIADQLTASYFTHTEAGRSLAAGASIGSGAVAD